MMAVRFVIDRQEAQPIADRIKFWVRDTTNGQVQIVFISFYDAADADSAARLALQAAEHD